MSRTSRQSSRLAGENERRRTAMPITVMRMETRMAEASLDNVALRDPAATDHKMAFAQLQQLAPSFNWSAYYKTAGSPRGRSTSPNRGSCRRSAATLTAVPVAEWKVYLRWHLLNSAAPSLSDDFVKEDFAFYDAYLNGATEMKPRWKRCVELTDKLARRSAREEIRREVLPGRSQGAHAGDGAEPPRRRWVRRSRGSTG